MRRSVPFVAGLLACAPQVSSDKQVTSPSTTWSWTSACGNCNWPDEDTDTDTDADTDTASDHDSAEPTGETGHTGVAGHSGVVHSGALHTGWSHSGSR